MDIRVPILAYHSLDIAGNQYCENDLVALASDLETIWAMEFEVIALSRLMDAWLRDPGILRGRRLVAVTTDDGSDFDFHDLPHPIAGRQRSVLNILRDFDARHPHVWRHLGITSFVIVSPEARSTLDRTCLIGRQWWNDDWWSAAVCTGLLEIASHSWDHNHETLPQGRFPGLTRGTFSNIVTEELADYEIAAAQAHLANVVPNPGLMLFAYPYGEANSYLVEDYLPRKADGMGIRCAFSDRPGFLEHRSSRWQVPRFVCRRDWTSPAGLQRILDEAAAGSDR